MTKTIGLLGGMSWASTAEYYRILNQAANAQGGGLTSAKLLLHSFDFAEIAAMQHADQWDELANKLTAAAKSMEDDGAELILICTNLMHKLAPQVQAGISVPLVHIADAVAEAIKIDSNSKVALLGTCYTMEEPFYRERLNAAGIDVIIPEGQEFQDISDLIYSELCAGKFTPEARNRYLEVIETLKAQGAEGVVMGCTEIPILLDGVDAGVPLYDTTAIHCAAAWKAVQNESKAAA